MKLERLLMQNFRCFDRLDVSFDPKLTVIVAENGAGKTAILDAIAVGFGRFLTKLPGIQGLKTRETDIRIDQGERRTQFMMLAWKATTYTGENLVWGGIRKRDGAVNTANITKALEPGIHDAAKEGWKQIDAYALGLVQDDADEKAYVLPVVAYYGTNRAIRDEVQRRRGLKKKFSRFDALAGALQPDSRFRAAFEWFSAMEDLERREKESRRNFDYRLPELDAVRSAIVRMLPPGFSKPRTEVRPLRFVIDRQMPDGVTRTLRLSQLSDGFRVILGLVMDLARRMAQANPHLVANGNQIANPLDLPAVVLIDEVDLHLHPQWQQTVLNDLMNVFRGAQFIVTTHSPQVLTTVPADCIRLIDIEMDEETGRSQTVLKPVTQQTQGVASSDVLAAVMGIDPVPDVEQAHQLSQYKALIQQGLHEAENGVALRNLLNAHFGLQHPLMLECDRLIRLHAFKQKLPQRG